MEINAPAILAPRLEADVVTDEGFPNKAAPPGPLNFPFWAYSAARPATWIAWGLWPLKRPPTWVIVLCWRAHAEGLTRTFLIINPQPALPSCLLGRWGSGRWTGRVGFDSPVPLFMGSIVARRSPATERGHAAFPFVHHRRRDQSQWRLSDRPAGRPPRPVARVVAATFGENHQPVSQLHGS